MSLTTKGTRPIDVDGKALRWHIRRSPTYCQGAFRTPMVVAVQGAGPDDRSVLVVTLIIDRPDNWIAPHQSAITPAVVRAIVRDARERGWDPASRGPFRMTFAVPKHRT